MGLLLLQGSAALNPRELFASGEQGLWLDPSQMSTLYQDSNGVTPCTASGDPVGLILDQSRGGLGALGSELVTNGDFSSGQTGWIDSPASPSGWSFTGGALVGSNANGGYEQAVQVTSGKWYRCTITLSNVSGGAVSFAISGAGAGPTFNSNGTNTVLINAGSTGNIGVIRRSSGFTGSVDNISIREVPGNHAYQTTSASRPTLARIPSSGRRNLLTRTEEFDNAAWTKGSGGGASSATVTANQSTSPVSTLTADQVDFPAVSIASSFSVVTRTITLVAGNHTFSVWLKGSVGGETVYLTLSDTIPSTSTACVLTTSWQRFSITTNATAGTNYANIGVDLRDATESAKLAQTVFIWGAQLETGSSPSNYQKVVATTDVTESGVGDLWHLVFDGSDDSLVTNSVDFTATDEMTVIAGLRKLSDAATAMLIELSATASSNAGSFYITAPGASGATPYESLARGDAALNANQQSTVTSIGSAPDSCVLSTTHDISSDLTTFRRNGADRTNATGDKGSGNFGNYALYIGRRGGSSLPYNGHIYQLIIRGRTTPTGKLLDAERFVARKTGVSF